MGSGSRWARRADGQTGADGEAGAPPVLRTLPIRPSGRSAHLARHRRRARARVRAGPVELRARDTVGRRPAAGRRLRPLAAGTVAFRVAAVEHLGQAESFLTLFRASVRGGARDGLAAPAARQLLATNRLMLDSPASADPKLRLLLEDLELVLAGIAQISPGRGSEDLDIITNDLDRSAVLLRLRAAVPAGGGAPARPGAL